MFYFSCHNEFTILLTFIFCPNIQMSLGCLVQHFFNYSKWLRVHEALFVIKSKYLIVKKGTTLFYIQLTFSRTPPFTPLN